MAQFAEQATVGVPFSFDFGQAVFGDIPNIDGITFTFDAQGLPPGISLSASGVFSGTPTQAGTYPFTINLTLSATSGTDTESVTIPIPYSITVVDNSGPPLAVSSTGLAFSASQGSTSSLSQSVVITNNASTAASFTVSASVQSGGNWLSASPASGSVAAFSKSPVTVTVDPSKLGTGTYLGSVAIIAGPANQEFDVSVILSVSGNQAQLQVSQSGLRFQTVASGGVPSTQSIFVLGTSSDPLKFSATASTTKGGDWLHVSPAGGTVSSSSRANIVVSVDPTNLQAGDYYGQILISADGAANSPQTVSVVFNVAPAGTDLGAFVSPTGLIFVAQAGGSDPKAKQIAVSNPSPTNLTFGVVPFFTQGADWFTVTPGNGAVNAANSPILLQVQPSLKGLAAGIYTGEVVLRFAEDNSSRHIAIVLIVTPGATNSAARAVSSSCSSTKLIPVFTQLGSDFSTVAAWPTPIEVTVVDDCGNLLTTGASVSASFSDGEPSLQLGSLNDGRWTATWQARSSASQIVITVNAQQAAPPLSGSQSIGGTLQSNPVAPSINAGGIVSAAKYGTNQPLAPGSFASIYGVNLGAGQNLALSLPLTVQLGATQVVLAGRALPLQYAGDGQVNAVIPYDIPPNTSQQLIISNGPALSVPETVVLAPAQPAVFAQTDGAGVVFGVKNGTTAQYLVDAQHPVSAGDAIVIYCAGLGAVDPPVAAGAAAPSSPTAQTTNPVTVTIGGKSAQVFYSGLVAGFAGLYQANAYVPKGVTPGVTVPLIVSVAGFDSAPVTINIK